MPDGHPYPDALPSGHRIGNYEIVDVLGRGGFGITYRALQLRLNRTVAIKEYLPRSFAARAPDGNVHPISPQETDSYEWGLKRYLKEAKTLARLDHPSIVRVYDYFEAHGTGYIVMEYIEGETLEAELRKRYAPPHGEELTKILDPLMDGLKIVHEAGILHRDITPNNIMLRESGTPVLIDFGAARDTSGPHTQTMTLIGTPKYAAPEQMFGRGKQGTWTDIYGLSAVVFRCMTESPPEDAIERMQSDDVEGYLESWEWKGSSEGLMTAVEQGLALKPQERPQTIADWRALARKVSKATVDKYQRDAESGNAVTQFQLGYMYATGVDVPQDRDVALKWYQLAANQGHKTAQLNLGILLYEDWCNRLGSHEDAYEEDEYSYYGGRPSYEEIKKIRLRAEQGHANSQLHMGFLHDRLYFHCIPAHDTDCDELKYGLDDVEGLLLEGNGIIYMEDRGVEHYGKVAYYWSEEKSLEDEESVKWYQLAAKQGVSRAQYNLGLKYFCGIGISWDRTEAKKWFGRAADRGHGAAQAHLGYMEYVAGNYTQAYLWCRLAAKDSHDYDHTRAHTGAHYLLGEIYYEVFNLEAPYPYFRQGDPFSYMKQAEYWHNFAALEGHPGARLQISVHYNRNFGSGYSDPYKIQDWIYNRCLSAVSGAT